MKKNTKLILSVLLLVVVAMSVMSVVKGKNSDNKVINALIEDENTAFRFYWSELEDKEKQVLAIDAQDVLVTKYYEQLNGEEIDSAKLERIGLLYDLVSASIHEANESWKLNLMNTTEDVLLLSAVNSQKACHEANLNVFNEAFAKIKKAVTEDLTNFKNTKSESDWNAYVSVMENIEANYLAEEKLAQYNACAYPFNSVLNKVDVLISNTFNAAFVDEKEGASEAIDQFARFEAEVFGKINAIEEQTEVVFAQHQTALEILETNQDEIAKLVKKHSK